MNLSYCSFYSWPFGDLFCTVFAEVGFLTGIGTINSLTLIAAYSFYTMRKLLKDVARYAKDNC